MKKLTIYLCFFLPFLASCRQELVAFQEGNRKITVEPGEAWLHDYPLFLGIKKKYVILFRKNLQLLLSAGYELQRRERRKTCENAFFSAEWTEKPVHNSLSVRAGLVF